MACVFFWRGLEGENLGGDVGDVEYEEGGAFVAVDDVVAEAPAE